MWRRSRIEQQAVDTLQNIQTKVDALQVKYDDETDHSREALQQTCWSNLIRVAIRNNKAALPDP